MKENTIKKIGVSPKNYNVKPDFKYVRYNTRENIAISQMVKLIQQGYSFSHAFKANEEYGNSEKTIANFKQTNYIWFDFDDCINSIDNAYQKLTFKPNIAYTTISNLKNGNLHRFRLIYITDFVIFSNENYKYYLNLLLNTILSDLGKEFIQYIDKHCFNVSLHMFGSNNNATIITNEDIIYNKNLFYNISNTYSIKNLLDKNKCSKKFNNNILKKEKKILSNCLNFSQ